MANIPDTYRPLLTVIIAVYKAEKYIERCARSLFGQTLEPMEFIFIDDCSPDGSIEVVKSVLEDYPMRKDQVKFLKNEVNSGVATTRHNAMEAATGVYVTHCDPDDYILNANSYELLINQALNEAADILIMGHALIWPDKRTDRYVKPDSDEPKKLADTLLTGGLNGYSCDKLFRLDLLRENGINYIPGVNSCEDLLLCVRAFCVSKKIVASPEIAYAYDQYSNPNSLRVHRINSKRREQEKLQLREWIKVFSECFPDQDSSVYRNGMTIAAHWHFSRGLLTGSEFRQMFKPYRKAFKHSGHRAAIKYVVFLSTFPALYGILRFLYGVIKR